MLIIRFCDTVQLLNEEYAALTPDTLESLGFLTSVAKDPGLSDTQKKVFGISFLHLDLPLFVSMDIRYLICLSGSCRIITISPQIQLQSVFWGWATGRLYISLRCNGHFSGESGLACVHWSKGWWRWWWLLEL